MREIKFRAWNKAGKRWCLRLELACLLYELVANRETDVLQHHIFMQYTGLKDKNGKDIYEGDIVKREDSLVTDDGSHWIAEVIYLNEPNHSGFQLKYYHKEESYRGISGYFQVDILEIIGNIYENPKLLK